LFDIDGTLVNTDGAGRTAMTRTFEELFEVPDPFHGDRFSGMTDPAILATATRRHFQRDPTANETTAFFKRYIEILKEDVAGVPGYRVLPGMKMVLHGLSSRPDCVVGLCTGNIEEGARIKLERGGLNRFFEFGGFGSDSEDRAELTRLAIERAKRRSGSSVDPVVIGDSTKDAAAARANNAKVALVATGWTDREVLRGLEPDFFFPSFEDHEEAIARLLGLGDGLRAGIDELDRAVRVVLAGGLIIHPTSTLYGLGGLADDPGVVGRANRLKGGRQGPLIVLVPDARSAFSLADGVPDAAVRLADRFWPGPLTLVLDAGDDSPSEVLGPDRTIAVRVDSHPFARALANAVGRPLLSTSANLSGAPPPQRAGDVDDGLVASCDLFIEDDGPIEGDPSTLVRVTGKGMEVLRQGAIREDRINECILG